MCTLVNLCGILWEYYHCPSYDPDAHVMPKDLATFTCDIDSGSSGLNETSVVDYYSPPWPFQNMSTFLLMNWANSGSIQKTEAEITCLGREVISSLLFRVENLALFNAH